MGSYGDHSAEFYETSAVGSGWPSHLELSDAARGRLRPTAGPLVDLGAGTGLSTLALARACPDAEILAVEPSPAMRAVLMSKVLADPDLTARVTLLDGGLDRQVITEPCGGGTARGLTQHLPPKQRDMLWASLAEHLAPGAGLLLDQVARHAPTSSAARVHESEHQVGRRTYRTTIDTDLEPDGSGRGTITSTVIDTRSGETIAEHVYEHGLYVFTRSMLERETAGHGLVVEDVDDALLCVTRG